MCAYVCVHVVYMHVAVHRCSMCVFVVMHSGAVRACVCMCVCGCACVCVCVCAYVCVIKREGSGGRTDGCIEECRRAVPPSVSVL